METDNRKTGELAAVSSTPWLAGVPMELAAKWYCELNCFRWPENFPLEKPPGYDAMTDRQKYDDPYCKQVWEAVNAYVPRKEQSRAWHMGGYCSHKKTTEEFEAWWASRESYPANACVSDGPADAPELTRSAEGPFAARNG